MFFWRKNKDGGTKGQAAARAGKGGKASAPPQNGKAQSAKSQGAKNQGAKKTAASKAPPAKAAGAKAPPAKASGDKAKGAKSGGKGGAMSSEQRAQAEAQMMRMLKDGSFEKNKKMSSMRDAGEVFDEYPDEAVRLVRNWMNGSNR